MRPIDRIMIDVIEHFQRRYDTVGDWQLVDQGKDGAQALYMRVSRMPDPRMSVLVAVHELIEALLCAERSITTQQVDDFDFACTDEEPGDNPLAPYHKEHVFATRVEQMLAQELSVSWEEYEKARIELGKEKET